MLFQPAGKRAGDRPGDWRWHCIRNQGDLLAEGPLKDVTRREPLQEHRFIDGQAAVTPGVHMNFTVPIGNCP